MAAPYLGFSNTPSVPLTLDIAGNAVYSPFFKEFLPETAEDFPPLEAKLNANENPYGPSPMALEALQKSAMRTAGVPAS